MSDRPLHEARRLLDAGQPVEAERLLLRSRSSSNEARFLLALVAAQTGRADDAIKSLRVVLSEDDEHREASVWLSTLLCQTGRAPEAASLAERASVLWPKDVDVVASLGHVRLALGDLEGAATAFLDAIKLAPDLAALHHSLAVVLRAQGKTGDAIGAFRLATELAPNSIVSRTALAGLLLEHGGFPEAVRLLETSLAQDPSSIGVRVMLARALSALNRRSEAESHYRKAVARSPRAKLAYGIWLQESGRFEEAARLLEEALEIEPLQGQAHYGLAMTARATAADRPRIARMEEAARHEAIRPTEAAFLHYGLGKLYDDLGEYEPAIGHFDRANDFARRIHLVARPFVLENLRRENDRTIHALGQEEVRRLSRGTLIAQRPIFIVGMIRSGTSLLEQIVGSHPKVAPAGELRYWLEEAPSALAKGLDPDRVRDLGDRYDDYLRALAPDSPRVTDKMPLNYAFVGLFAAAFPRAPILHIRRDPVDTCLSIYMTPYASPPDWAYVRESIVANYREYERLMAHWRTVLPPGRMLEIDYETLVDDREGTVRRVIDFCGLPWDDACLSHEQSRQTVGTPSVWQVRQPIYRTSVERWRRYEPWLGAFSELLERS